MVGRGGIWWARIRRGLRAALVTVAVVLAVVVLALALAPVRGALLGVALRVADARLPGTLAADELAWPDPGRLRVAGLVWRSDAPTPAAAFGDTLVHLRSLELGLDLGALRRRDLLVQRLQLDVECLDLPELAATLPAGSAPPDSTPDPGTGGVPWLRTGAARDLPSIAGAGLEIGVERAVLAPGLHVDGIALTADLDAAHGAGAASLGLRGGGRVTGGDTAPWLVDVPSLALRLRYGPDRGVVAVDTCRVRVAAAGPQAWGPRWREGGPAEVELAGTARIDPQGVTADLQGAVAAPLAALVAERWPADLPRTDYERFGADFSVDGSASRRDGLQGEVALDLAGSPGWGRSRLVVGGGFVPEKPEATDLQLDTLAVALPGLAVAGSGALRGDAYELTVRVDATTPAPLLVLAGPQAASLDLAAACEIGLKGRGLPTAADADAVRLRLRGGGQAAGGVATPWAVEVPTLALDVEYHLARREIAVDTCRVRVTTAGPVAWAERWRDGAPGELDLSGTARLDTAAIAVDARGTLRVPPVALAGDRWPADLPPDDFTEFAAAFTVIATGDRRTGITGRVGLDMGGSLGWGRSRLAVAGTYDPRQPAATDLQVDTLSLVMPGVEVTATGTLRGDAYQVTARGDVATPLPLLALAGPDFAAAELAAGFELEATGTGRDPRGRLALTADFQDDRLSVRDLHLVAERDTGAATAHLAVGEVTADAVVLADSLVATASYGAARDLPFGLGLQAHLAGDQLVLGAAAALDSLITVRLDSLRMMVAGQDIALLAPATAQLDTAGGVFDLDRLALAGQMGTLDLAAALHRDDLNLEGAVDLRLQEEVLQLLAPASFWSEDGGRDFLLRGDLLLAGSRADPQLTGELAALLHPHRERPVLGAQLRLGLAAGDTSGLAAAFSVTSDDTVLFHGRAVLPGRFVAVDGIWQVHEEGDLLVEVPEQTLPIRYFMSLVPGGLETVGTVTIGGRLRVPPQGPDDARPGEVDGVLRTKRLRLTGPNRSRAEVKIDCRLTGPAGDPRLEGKITVPSAFLRLPEIPRSLHAVEGRALLWDAMAADTLGLVGSVAGAAAPDWGPGAAETKTAILLPDLDLQVELPGNTRVNGYGLDAEVSGEVAVTRGHDEDGLPGPALRGRVQTVQGTVKVMSRVFEIQRCEIDFTGQVPPNPELAMNLLADISGTSIRVQVSGRANDPVVTLSSSPDMNEADIMAFLIFGRPLNDLDGDQRGRMQEEENPRQQLNENLAALAFAFGTRDLQQSVTSTLGVDMMEVGSDAKGGSTISAGKFIGPKVLVKYHHSLEKSGSYFMTLEYFINRVFRLVSTYGQGEEASGLEVQWLKRY